MKNQVFYFMVLLGILFSSTGISAATLPEFNYLPDSHAVDLSWVNEVGARTYPQGKKYIVNAVGDGRTLCTKQVQEAIDECSWKGGGQVVFEPGTYLIGAIYLKEGVDLHIGREVVLLSCTDFDCFPRSRSRVAGVEMIWPDGLINVINQENVAISGEGKIDCRGQFCWDKYQAMREEYEQKNLRWIVDYDCERIRGIVVNNSKNVTIKDFRIERTGFWGIQIVYSQYCTIDGVYIDNNLGGTDPVRMVLTLIHPKIYLLRIVK